MRLLYSLFGPVEEVAKLQQPLSNISAFINEYRHQAIFANKIQNINRESNDLKCSVTFAPQLPPAWRGECCRKRDESLFSNELRMLRDLLAPLRDTSKPIYRVTDNEYSDAHSTNLHDGEGEGLVV
ncbi:hypothetical protein N7463_006485 [Penicillium fimorum]|uniref:Uncharacterized protein n=1 Tax=Penicillium fimorum TaxID=1882269 RepID=A0A9W9XVT3_9EURO|nr:hypothetical protein N7463_006485 [Penicillium fimorum]